MTTKSKNHFQEETINLGALKLADVDFEFRELGKQPVDKELTKVVIRAPEHPTFKFDHNIIERRVDAFLRIVEGFTLGALYNMIIVTRNQLRVYAATQDKITFLSCSEIPEPISTFVVSYSYPSWLSVLVTKKRSTIQLLITDCETNRMVMELHPETGKFLSVRTPSFYNFDHKHHKFLSAGLPTPKNSKIDSFHVLSTTSEKLEGEWSIFQNRAYNLRKWVDLSRKLRHHLERELDR